MDGSPSTLLGGLPMLDAGSIGCAILFPTVRWVKSLIWSKCHAHAMFLFLDLLRGAAFFPFIIVIIGVIHRPLLEDLAKANPTTLFLSGVIGAFAVFNSDKWMIDLIRKHPELLD